MTRLRHVTFRLPVRYEHFYEGFVISQDGYVDCPERENDTWLKNLFYRGYRLAPDGRQLFTWFDVLAEKEKQASTGETLERPESSDIGRQPEVTNRIRKSQHGGRKGVPA